jgi:hypothetical protein
MSKQLASALTAPYTSASAVDLSSADAVFSPRVPRALYVGVSGDVVVTLTDDGTNSVTFKAAPVGILPVRPGTVVKTGTTATNILALW